MNPKTKEVREAATIRAQSSGLSVDRELLAKLIPIVTSEPLIEVKRRRRFLLDITDERGATDYQMKDSSRRRLRGLAAQSYILTMMYVSANLRKIARFLRDAQRRPNQSPSNASAIAKV